MLGHMHTPPSNNLQEPGEEEAAMEEEAKAA